jgi:parvulin-like peptidyl-prolyl isomerase
MIITLVVGLLFAYILPNSWGVTGKVRSVLPLPSASVGMHGVASFNDIAENLSSVRRFYETQDFAALGMRVDFMTPDGQKRLKIREKEILNKMIEDEALRLLAARDGILISEEDAAKAVSGYLHSIGGEEKVATEKLSRLYGWNLAEFEEKVVLPSLLEEELRKRFESDAVQFAGARAEAEQGKKLLLDGRSFSDVAREVSDGRTAADKGGAMGWFSYENLALPLQEPARTQDIGESGNIIESTLGFHILQVDERKTEKGKELVRLSQIFIAKRTFGDWLSDEMRKMDIRMFAPEYKWNDAEARADFRDADFQRFEKEILEKSEGDASVLF